MLCKCGCLSKVDYGVDVGVTVSLVRFNLKSVTECYRKACVYVGADVSSHLCILNAGASRFLLPIKSIVALGSGFVSETFKTYLLILNYPKIMCKF